MYLGTGILKRIHVKKPIDEDEERPIVVRTEDAKYVCECAHIHDASSVCYDPDGTPIKVWVETLSGVTLENFEKVE